MTQSRRSFLKQLGAAAAAFAAFPAGAQSERKPNVIYILTDDQGTIDMNCYGAKDLYTPNMDRLAAEGSRFTQFYAASPVCSPSRAAFMTGKTPFGAGLPANASSAKDEGRAMPPSQVTIAEQLKQIGYKTGHVGKWHLGYTKETMPNAQGFDYSFGHMGGCIDNWSHFFYWNGPNRHDLWENGVEIWREGQYFPDLMTDKALEYIEANKNEPFFLYYAINLPHYPLQPTEKWREYYKELPHPRRDYAAFVSTIDERIGIILDKLDELGIREETIIVLQSDHGHSMEERTFGAGGSAGIYRGAKFSLFEGGIRVPAIISWKGHLPENQVIDAMACEVDWFPTVAELCGATPLPPKLAGKSLLPLIENPGAPTRHKQYWWKLHQQWAVRDGDWKLIGNPRDTSNKAPLDPKRDALFLVNLKEDPTEMTNLAAKYPEQVERLKKLYMQWEYAEPSDIPGYN